MKEHAECTWVLFNPSTLVFVPVHDRAFIPIFQSINISYAIELLSTTNLACFSSPIRMTGLYCGLGTLRISISILKHTASAETRRGEVSSAEKSFILPSSRQWHLAAATLEWLQALPRA
jgi:tRNA/tmRNA/rRNA uracil-C5-methylase (TrmA/RlmC/RlmD family)